MSTRLGWLALSPVLALPALARAQGVLVAPHAVVIEHRTRSAAITLYNPGGEPTEVTISGFFGYPVTDSAGDLELATPDAAAAGLPSAAAWIDAYPRRVVIGPLERQTVRLLGRPPAGLPDGEYWSRLMIRARDVAPPVATPDSASGIAIGLDLEVRTVIPVQYRKGRVTTAARVERLRAETRGDSLLVRARLAREGNAAFIGTARVRLYDAAGAAVAATDVPLAVYVEIDPRLSLPVAGLGAGRYRLELELVAHRADLPPEQVLSAAPARQAIAIDLP
jgi:hypothetical protein